MPGSHGRRTSRRRECALSSPDTKIITICSQPRRDRRKGPQSSRVRCGGGASMCAHAVERYRRGGGRSRAVEPGPVQDVEDRNGQSCCLEVPMTLKGDHLVRLRAGNVVAAALAMGLVLVLGSTAMAAPVG